MERFLVVAEVGCRESRSRLFNSVNDPGEDFAPNKDNSSSAVDFFLGVVLVLAVRSICGVGLSMVEIDRLAFAVWRVFVDSR